LVSSSNKALPMLFCDVLVTKSVIEYSLVAAYSLLPILTLDLHLGHFAVFPVYSSGTSLVYPQLSHLKIIPIPSFKLLIYKYLIN